MIRDVGNFFGRYFQILGLLILAGIVVNIVMSGRVVVDLNFLLCLWAGDHLRQHTPAARRWTIGLCGVIMGLVALMIAVAAVWGPDRGRLGSFVVTVGWMVVVLGIPVALLMTPKARREFSPSIR